MSCLYIYLPSDIVRLIAFHLFNNTRNFQELINLIKVNQQSHAALTWKYTSLGRILYLTYDHLRSLKYQVPLPDSFWTDLARRRLSSYPQVLSRLNISTIMSAIQFIDTPADEEEFPLMTKIVEYCMRGFDVPLYGLLRERDICRLEDNLGRNLDTVLKVLNDLQCRSDIGAASFWIADIKQNILNMMKIDSYNKRAIILYDSARYGDENIVRTLLPKNDTKLIKFCMKASHRGLRDTDERPNHHKRITTLIGWLQNRLTTLEIPPGSEPGN